MKPEGIVIDIDEQRYKKVLKMKKLNGKKVFQKILKNFQKIDISYLLQPIRLEKLIFKR